MKKKLYLGDCLEILKTLPANIIDACVTDPPYELGFMGKDWDKAGISFQKETWEAIYRVLKPGAHMLVFGGTRTWHRIGVAIEDAGFEIRDTVMWVYGQGFPKSHNVSKAIDKMKGAKREKIIGTRHRNVKPYDDENGWNENNTTGDFDYTAPATEEAKQWDGWGTALKPAFEPIIVARKPLESTVAENVLKYSTGAINIDACRIEAGDKYTINTWDDNAHPFGDGAGNPYTGRQESKRWPANLIHDGSEEVMELFPETTTGSGHVRASGNRSNPSSWKEINRTDAYWQGDSGSAARFFYCAKASKDDRWFFCYDCHDAYLGKVKEDHGHGHVDDKGKQTWDHVLFHNTVKPTDLMRYLCRLVTPPGGIVLDPFMGSGSTGKVTVLGDFSFVGIEINEEYYQIARKRIEYTIEHRAELLKKYS